MIPVEDARRLILSTIQPTQPEATPLLSALGRVLAETVHSPVSHPPFDNSSMDGYAVRAHDLAQASKDAPVWLPVIGEVAAGCGEPPTVGPGEACRIMTGAILPPGADSVVMVEETREEDGRVRFTGPCALGQSVRRAGEDLAQGACVLEAGTPLNAARVGLLAGVGRAQVQTHRPPRVAILTTGDELVQPGEPLGPGQIYASNAYAIAGMVLEAGAIPVPCGVARDDREETRRLIHEALECDVVITSGGVSMGRFDHVSEALAELGTIHFDRVAQQPGKPLTYATLSGKPVFGLPGNPASTMVCFEHYVRPALLKMMGHRQVDRRHVRAILTEDIRKPLGKTSFLRAVVEEGPEGYRAALTGSQSSGMMTSMAMANALIIVPAERDGARAGEAFDALLLGS
ncbi:molybdopterin molybdotransferase MoeA [bacterium]|nr:molybdopterin molybdotransferase MoeA [bacterium]